MCCTTERSVVQSCAAVSVLQTIPRRLSVTHYPLRPCVCSTEKTQSTQTELPNRRMCVFQSTPVPCQSALRMLNRRIGGNFALRVAFEDCRIVPSKGKQTDGIPFRWRSLYYYPLSIRPVSTAARPFQSLPPMAHGQPSGRAQPGQCGSAAAVCWATNKFFWPLLLDTLPSSDSVCVRKFAKQPSSLSILVWE